MSERSGGAVTLLDVARRAGVSLAAASRAFNGSSTRTVREDLRLRVLQAASEPDYNADAQAQAMARGRTDVVGPLVHDVAEVEQGYRDFAVLAGPSLLLTSSDRRAGASLPSADVVRAESTRDGG